MINPIILNSFYSRIRKEASEVSRINKAASIGRGLSKEGSLKALGLIGLGGTGALTAMTGAGLAGNVRRDMQYGRAERLEEKARRMKAMAAARNMPAYNQNLGGM